jgi:hypothetical protein
MQKSTMGMILCASVGILYVSLHATRVFKALLPVENASQYAITLSNSNGTAVTTIEANQSSDVRLSANQTIRISARIDDHDISTDATRDALDLSWKIDVDSNIQQINVTKTAQQAGRYDPKPRRNTNTNQ